jgi:hypothetical protein
MDTTCRKGKIGSLPADVRRDLNARMFNGEKGPRLLSWLNGIPSVQAILQEQWKSEPVSSSNLSEWRAGGYQDYVAQHEMVEHTRELAQFAMSLAKAAGGDLAAGPAAIAAGKLLTAIESATTEEMDGIVSAISALRGNELKAKDLSLKEGKLVEERRVNSLAEQKFERETARLFLEWFEDKRAREIAESSDSKDVKMDRIIAAMFGQRPAQK